MIMPAADGWTLLGFVLIVTVIIVALSISKPVEHSKEQQTLTRRILLWLAR